ncbi:unnamed protein product [Angiostrongylus costaricensis]|uniref:VWFA domain-containing protein n=1 Tax=Angiostrongylus costaricensis TaxID=334426 RepID=A0A158PJ38_ANGCS|nr:unnamed protein product [Angiostrongylus costaricensis]
MCSADIVGFFLQAAIVTVFWLPIADTSTAVVNDIQTKCTNSDVDVVVVIDTTSTSMNTTEFLVQQHRLLRTLNLIASMRQSGQSTSNSVVRALDEALSMFFESRPTDEFHQRNKIIILAHDGVNTDLVAETLETVSNIEKLGVVVFALTGSSRPNTFALLGYAGLRDRLFISDTDRATFEDSLSEVDLIIVLDTSGSVFRVFDDQRAIALEIMEEIPLDAFADSVQVSVVRFAASADVILPFLKGRAYSEIKDTIREVKFTGQNTRIAGAVGIAIDEMMRARRPDAVQVFILISDGHGQEYWNVVQAAGKRLQKTGAELFAVSASPDYNKAELLIYVGDESRVFVGRKYDSFLPTISSYLNDCVSNNDKSVVKLPGKHRSLEILTTTEPSTSESLFSSTTSKSFSIMNEPSTTVDLIMSEEFPSSVEPIGDVDEGDDGGNTSEEMTKASLRLRDIAKLAIRTVELFPTTEFSSGKIHVGVISFAQGTRLELPLDRGHRELVINALRNIHHIGGTRSSVSGARLALQQFISFRRLSARLVTVLYSSGHSQGYWSKLIKTSVGLRDVPNSVLLAVTRSKEFPKNEIQNWAGESSKVFMFNEDEEFLHAVSREIGVCSKEAKLEKIGDVENIVENEKHTTLLQNPDLLSMKAKDILDENSANGFEESTTVDGNVMAVKRLPSEDFEHRIQVGVVVFNRKAEVVLKMSEFRTRSAVLDSLLLIRHSGGGTSVAKGITAALDEIQKNRRSGARLVVVLLSDGNSQDHWDDVVRSSNKLRTTGGDIYAVSTARNYMFRELELYAGSKLRVYIDGRVHKFLDDIEQQIVLCGRFAESRLSVSTISFAHNSTVVSAFGLLPKNEVIFELERIANASGPASLPTATSAAFMEIKAHRRKGSRIIVVILSSGNGGKDSRQEVRESAISLRSSDAEVFAVSLSPTANLEKLKEYTGNDKNLYVDRKSDKFIQDVGSSILSCTANANGVKNTESEEELTHPDDIFGDNLIQFEPVGKKRKCVYEKMDLQIILDASSSRQEVFEHQKELALSLVERLPISADGSKVAIGISSFTSVPVIRQTLGLGRNKKVKISDSIL